MGKKSFLEPPISLMVCSASLDLKTSSFRLPEGERVSYQNPKVITGSMAVMMSFPFPAAGKYVDSSVLLSLLSAWAYFYTQDVPCCLVDEYSLNYSVIRNVNAEGRFAETRKGWVSEN